MNIKEYKIESYPQTGNSCLSHGRKVPAKRNSRLGLSSIIRTDIPGALFRMAFTGLLISCGLALSGGVSASSDALNVVSTTTDFAYVAEYIGGSLVNVFSIAHGDEDVHFIRPKPSFAHKLGSADLLLSTGMDLELWLPGLIDKASNSRVIEGREGFVAVADGFKKLEIPESADRSHGGVHLFGNPHIQTSPINMKTVADNITIGLIKVDPEHRGEYEEGLASFRKEIDQRLFGDKLVELIGSSSLCRLASSGKLISFLGEREYKGTPMIDYLDGWMKKALPLRGRKIVTYHKNWVYFTKLFGMEVVGEVEPKPAIPPSPKDVETLINKMRTLRVPVILAANYFDETKIRRVTDAVGAAPVIVPVSVDGAPGVDSYFDLVDLWLDSLLAAFGAES